VMEVSYATPSREICEGVTKRYRGTDSLLITFPIVRSTTHHYEMLPLSGSPRKLGSGHHVCEAGVNYNTLLLLI